MSTRNAWIKGIAAIALGLCCRDAQLAAQEPAADDASLYAGNETCTECHAAQALTGPHGATSDLRSPASKHSCETCHGPAKEHVKFQEDDDGSSAVDPTLEALRVGLTSGVTVEKRNASCVECHTGGSTALWDGSKHQMRDVSCVDCHSPHSKNPKYLRGETQPDLCSSCHKDVKAELQRTSHHPIREGKMQCSDCHNVHGTIADKLISANSTNDKCYECHAEKRGPFVWDHAPVQENCLSCHTAHGSSHEMLLTQKVPFLCQSCHSNSGHPGTLYAIPEGSGNRNPFVMLPNLGFNRACGNCHLAVHGSNSPSGKTLIR